MLLAVALTPIVIHQMGKISALQGVNGRKATDLITEFVFNFGKNFRTFKHGGYHGIPTDITRAMTFVGMNPLFERKSIRYVLVCIGYWTLAATLMGGIIREALNSTSLIVLPAATTASTKTTAYTTATSAKTST